MQMTEIAMFAADVDRVADFYEKLLRVSPERTPGEKAVFNVGGLTVLIHKREEPMAGYPPDEDHIAYAVTDVDDVYRDLIAQGFRTEAGPKDYPWGRAAYVRDPDGRLVELKQDA